MQDKINHRFVAFLCLTAALEMNRLGARRALVSLCVGVGQGLALAMEAVV